MSGLSQEDCSFRTRWTIWPSGQSRLDRIRRETLGPSVAGTGSLRYIPGHIHPTSAPGSLGYTDRQRRRNCRRIKEKRRLLPSCLPGLTRYALSWSTWRATQEFRNQAHTGVQMSAESMTPENRTLQSGYPVRRRWCSKSTGCKNLHPVTSEEPLTCAHRHTETTDTP